MGLAGLPDGSFEEPREPDTLDLDLLTEMQDSSSICDPSAPENHDMPLWCVYEVEFGYAIACLKVSTDERKPEQVRKVVFQLLYEGTWWDYVCPFEYWLKRFPSSCFYRNQADALLCLAEVTTKG